MNNTRGSRGLSPVIGVILLVALTVALVGLFTGVLFDTAESSVSTSPDVSVELIQNDKKVEMTVFHNGNVDEIYLSQNGEELQDNEKGTTYDRVSDVGDVYIADSEAEGSNLELGESVQVIVVMEGSKVMLTSFETIE